MKKMPKNNKYAQKKKDYSNLSLSQSFSSSQGSFCQKWSGKQDTSLTFQISENALHNSKKKTYKQPRIRESPVGKTKYLPLTNQDLLYYGNLHHYKSQDFQFVLRKITRDLNLLLHFRNDDFWVQLTTSQSSESLRNCLSSCLQNLTRKCYGVYDKVANTVPQTAAQSIQGLQNFEPFNLMRGLTRVVLLIYHRMVCESNKQQKQLIYQYWLLDIPKMFDLISIYKQTNHKILQQILKTVYKQMTQYEEDVWDFGKILMEVGVQAIYKDLEFQYTMKIIKQCKNFSNPILSFTRNLVKGFFRVFDFFNTLCDFFDYFPRNYIMIVIGQAELLLALIDCYFQYCDNLQKKWQLTKEFKEKFCCVIQKIRQKMIEFFIKSMDFLNEILKTDLQTQIWKNCLQIYFVICKEFSVRKKSPRSQKWQTLVKIIILQTPHRKVFVKQSFFSKYLDKSQLLTIDKCIKFENQYRNELASPQFNMLEKLQLKLSSIKSFKQWKDFQLLQNFDVMAEDSCHGITIQQDSLLFMMQNQMRQEKSIDSQYSSPSVLQPKSSNSKTNIKEANIQKRYPYFEQSEYNDEPIQQDDQVEQAYIYPFGMNKLEQVTPECEFGNQAILNGDNEQYPLQVQYFQRKQQLNQNQLSLYPQNQYRGQKQDNYVQYFNIQQESSKSINASKENTTKKSKKGKPKQYADVKDLSLQLEMGEKSKSKESFSVSEAQFSHSKNGSGKSRSGIQAQSNKLVIDKIEIRKQLIIFKSKQEDKKQLDEDNSIGVINASNIIGKNERTKIEQKSDKQRQSQVQTDKTVEFSHDYREMSLTLANNSDYDQSNNNSYSQQYARYCQNETELMESQLDKTLGKDGDLLQDQQFSDHANQVEQDYRDQPKRHREDQCQNNIGNRKSYNNSNRQSNNTITQQPIQQSIQDMDLSIPIITNNMMADCNKQANSQGNIKEKNMQTNNSGMLLQQIELQKDRQQYNSSSSNQNIANKSISFEQNYEDLDLSLQMKPTPKNNNLNNTKNGNQNNISSKQSHREKQKSNNDRDKPNNNNKKQPSNSKNSLSTDIEKKDNQQKLNKTIQHMDEYKQSNQDEPMNRSVNMSKKNKRKYVQKSESSFNNGSELDTSMSNQRINTSYISNKSSTRRSIDEINLSYQLQSAIKVDGDQARTVRGNRFNKDKDRPKIAEVKNVKQEKPKQIPKKKIVYGETW